jgi:hypothetical protein
LKNGRGGEWKGEKRIEKRGKGTRAGLSRPSRTRDDMKEHENGKGRRAGEEVGRVNKRGMSGGEE